MRRKKVVGEIEEVRRKWDDGEGREERELELKKNLGFDLFAREERELTLMQAMLTGAEVVAVTTMVVERADREVGGEKMKGRREVREVEEGKELLKENGRVWEVRFSFAGSRQL